MASTMQETGWQRPALALDQASLRALIAGEIPAIRMAGFASGEECRRFCAAIRKRADEATAAVTARMSLIGANFSNYTGQTKQGYFDLVEPSYRAVGAIAEEVGFDPLQRMMERLREIWPADVDVATEPGHGRYFAGGIKTRTTSGNLHYDFVPHSAAGFAIAQIEDQLGWNLYLDMPRDTGGTTTYRHPMPRDSATGGGPARVLNLDQQLIQQAEAFTFQPQVGEVVIINTRYPHDIRVENAAPDEWRVQTSSFIGRLPNDDLILWS